MFESFAKRRYGVRLSLREIHIVTEYRGGCVYRTRSLGLITADSDYFNNLKKLNPNIIVSSVSTRVSRAINC